MIGSRQWPLLAARMQQPGQTTDRLSADTYWQEATATALVGGLVG
ncbi:hypothetical protein [Streptomyces erythrochromogenes]